MRLRQATVALLWRAGGRGRSRSFVLRGRRTHFHLLMLHCLGRQRRGAYGQAGRAEVATAAARLQMCDGGPDARWRVGWSATWRALASGRGPWVVRRLRGGDRF